MGSEFQIYFLLILKYFKMDTLCHFMWLTNRLLHLKLQPPIFILPVKTQQLFLSKRAPYLSAEVINPSFWPFWRINFKCQLFYASPPAQYVVFKSSYSTYPSPESVRPFEMAGPRNRTNKREGRANPRFSLTGL